MNVSEEVTAVVGGKARNCGGAEEKKKKKIKKEANAVMDGTRAERWGKRSWGFPLWASIGSSLEVWSLSSEWFPIYR